MSCLLVASMAHAFLCNPGLSGRRAVRVGVRVLQREEGVGGDGALALALAAGQQVGDGQLSTRERHGGDLGRGGEGLQMEVLLLLVVLLLLNQLEEQRLLLLLLLLVLGQREGKTEWTLIRRR